MNPGQEEAAGAPPMPTFKAPPPPPPAAEPAEGCKAFCSACGCCLNCFPDCCEGGCH